MLNKPLNIKFLNKNVFKDLSFISFFDCLGFNSLTVSLTFNI